MLGGRLDVAAAAAGAAEKRRDELLVFGDTVVAAAASAGRNDASNLEDWPLQRMAARSNFMVVIAKCCKNGR